MRFGERRTRIEVCCQSRHTGSILSKQLDQITGSLQDAKFWWDKFKMRNKFELSFRNIPSSLFGRLWVSDIRLCLRWILFNSGKYYDESKFRRKNSFINMQILFLFLQTIAFCALDNYHPFYDWLVLNVKTANNLPRVWTINASKKSQGTYNWVFSMSNTYWTVEGAQLSHMEKVC